MKMRLDNSEFGSITCKKEIVYDFNRPKRDALEISKTLLNALNCENKVEQMITMIKDLRCKYKPRCKRLKNVLPSERK
jgi:hypothetical protein